MWNLLSHMYRDICTYEWNLLSHVYTYFLFLYRDKPDMRTYNVVIRPPIHT